MESGKKSKVFYGYIVLGAIWIIYFFNVSTPLYGVSAINANMVAQTGFDAAAVGLAVSICTLMQGLTGPIVGVFIRKKGVKLPLLIGSVLLVAGSLLIAFFTRSSTSLVLFYGVLVGAGMGFAGILTTQCVVNEWFQAKKALALAIAVSAGAIGGFVLPQLCQAISGVRWNLGWIFIAVTCCISILLTLFVMVNRPADIGEVPDGRAYHEKHAVEEAAAEAEGPVYKMSRVFRTSAFYLILTNNALRGALYYACVGHIVLFLVGKGVAQTAAVFVISIMSLASLCGRFLAGALTGRFFHARYNCVAANIFCAVAILVLLFGKSPMLLNLGGILMGLGIGVGYIGMPMVTSECYGKENFSAVSGWLSSVNYIMSAVGPLVAGFMAKYTGSYVLTFLIFGALSVLGAVAALTIHKPDPATMV